jgi:hypothetical protein
MEKDYFIDLMLCNTDFTYDEIMEMEKWEILSYLGLD